MNELNMYTYVYIYIDTRICVYCAYVYRDNCQTPVSNYPLGTSAYTLHATPQSLRI